MVTTDPGDDAVDRMVATNRAHWDARTDVHVRSAFYDLDAVRRNGPRAIVGPDEAEVGYVAGRSLLHLHCHLGTDSLRWAALGARVTGVDLSPRSVDTARSLARELGLDATFVCADVMHLDDPLGSFDVVYASHGVLCWVPDVWLWAAVAASHVGPGGFLYVAEGHPFDVAFDPARFGRTGYLDRGPRAFVDRRSYTELDTEVAHPENYRWSHTVGDVVTAIADAGLRIDFVHEHPRVERDDDDLTGVTERRAAIPSSAPGILSVKASRPTSVEV